MFRGAIVMKHNGPTGRHRTEITPVSDQPMMPAAITHLFNFQPSMLALSPQLPLMPGRSSPETSSKPTHYPPSKPSFQLSFTVRPTKLLTTARLLVCRDHGLSCRSILSHFHCFLFFPHWSVFICHLVLDCKLFGKGAAVLCCTAPHTTEPDSIMGGPRNYDNINNNKFLWLSETG